MCYNRSLGDGMMNPDERKYYLVVRVGKNSFMPIDWSQTNFYHGENLYSLSGIDKYTSQILSLNLMDEIMHQGLMSPDDLFSSFEILYIENETNHTVKEGPIFKEDEHILSENELIEYIINNRNNKEIINNILMQCNIKETDEVLDEFKRVLRNISYYEDDIDRLRNSLNIFKQLSYFQKRRISIRVSNSTILKSQEKVYEKRLQSEGNVA